MKNNKDKSIKKTMRSWIMLSDKELDDTQVYMQEQENMETPEKESDKEALDGRQRLSREEEIEQLTQEVGQEVVDENDEEMPMPRRRRKRHDDKKKESSNEETEQLGQEEVAEPEKTTAPVETNSEETKKEEKKESKTSFDANQQQAINAALTNAGLGQDDVTDIGCTLDEATQQYNVTFNFQGTSNTSVVDASSFAVLSTIIG